MGAMSNLATETRLAPLGDVLEAASSQMEELAARCCRLQDALGPFLVHGVPLEAQTLDLITQRLAAMALFFGELSTRMPPEIKVNAAAAASPVPLSDLATLLSLEPLLPSQASAGELDLFG
jgi:hypothetical protein